MDLTATNSAEWIDNDDRLAELCQHWQRQSAIALDSEFIRTRTYFPIIGLLQVADSENCYLIDPLAIPSVEPLKQVFQNESVVKVIHSCSEDLEVFGCYPGVLPAPVFDTQIAAAFAGYGESVGYANLMKAAYDIDIPKHETRSDWLQRPLSRSQCQYATLDVCYLLPLYQQLRNSLENTGRLGWVLSDCQKFLRQASADNRGDDYYRRIKSAWKLQPGQLSVLRGLCRWREQQVKRLNIPRNHLVRDKTLWDLARHLPDSIEQLARAKEMHPRFVENHGRQCLQLVAECLDRPDDYPDRLPPPLTCEQAGRLKSLKAFVGSIAELQRLPPGLLVRKKDLETLVRQSEQSGALELPHLLQDWRRDIIGEPLLEYLSKGSGGHAV